MFNEQIDVFTSRKIEFAGSLNRVYNLSMKSLS